MPPSQRAPVEQRAPVPSVTTSSAPVAATVAPDPLASSRARSTTSRTSAVASTPRTAPLLPVSAATSPALPRTPVHRTSASRRQISEDRNELVPAPTGSRTTGMSSAFARLPARTIASAAEAVKVPVFRTSAPACATTSSTSSAARAITGAAPRARVMLATSPAVTGFVM